MGSREPWAFEHMATLLREWLTGARLREIARALDLIGDELRQRGRMLTWSMTPPFRGDEPER